MAYEKVEFNKYDTLTAEQMNLIQDAIVQAESNINNVSEQVTDVQNNGVKIEVGSYVGTGTYGSSNKNSIPINKTTQLVIVQAADHTKLGGYGYYWMLCIRGNTTSSNSSPTTSNLAKYVNTLEWDEETLSWYNDNYEGDQLNMSGTMYKYISIG